MKAIDVLGLLMVAAAVGSAVAITLGLPVSPWFFLACAVIVFVAVLVDTW